LSLSHHLEETSLVELTHEFTVPVPVQEAWDHFQDIASVAECFPGAQVTSTEGATFAGSVKVKLGPIALVYNGTGTFTEKDETAYRFVVDAKGKDKRGNGTAGATVTLSMDGSAGDSTDVKVHTDLAITGKPAQFGRGVMQDVSDKLLGQFVDCLEQRMGEGDGSTAPAAGATASLPAEEAAAAAPATPAEEPTAAQATPPTEAPGAAAAADPAAPAAAAPGARKAAPAATRGSDDALNLGTTVLPVLVKSYWKQALAGVAVIGVIVWIVTR
jgi:carbon monoxide dehydrogenase subunit G